MTQSHFFRPPTSGLLTVPRASSLPANIASAMDCPMNASPRLIFSAVSSVFLCALLLITGVSCDRKAAGAKAPGSDPPIETLIRDADDAFAEARFEDALIPYEKALTLIDKDGDPKRWAGIAARAAQVHGFLGDWTGAQILLLKVCGLCEQHYGPEARETVHSRNQLKIARREGSQQPEAEGLLRLALAKDETSFGENSLEVASDLKDLAELLQATHRLPEAEQLMRRHLVLCVSIAVETGHTNPDLKSASDSYRSLLVKMGETEAVIEKRVGKLMEPIVKK